MWNAPATRSSCANPSNPAKTSAAPGATSRAASGFSPPGKNSPPRVSACSRRRAWADIETSRAPRVAILATGDELRPAGQPLGPGEIYESNGTLLAALAASLGADVTVLERARDERADLDAKLAAGLGAHDVLVVAGGVSVGERDLVKERLAAAGVRLDLWRVRVQPGKPFLYGPTGQRGARHARFRPAGQPGFRVRDISAVRASGAAQAPGRGRRALVPARVPGDGRRSNSSTAAAGRITCAARSMPAGRSRRSAVRNRTRLFALSRSRALVRVEPGTTVPAGARCGRSSGKSGLSDLFRALTTHRKLIIKAVNHRRSVLNPEFEPVPRSLLTVASRASIRRTGRHPPLSQRCFLTNLSRELAGQRVVPAVLPARRAHGGEALTMSLIAARCATPRPPPPAW